MIRLYFDACAINRLFDHSSQVRVREEAEATRAALTRARAGEFLWVSSSVLEEELERIADERRRSEVLAILSAARERTSLNSSFAAQVHAAIQVGISAFDAAHLVCAESAGCDVLLTTDDRFCKRAQRFPTHVHVTNPVDWMRGRAYDAK